jgi:hypothetical protein
MALALGAVLFDLFLPQIQEKFAKNTRVKEVSKNSKNNVRIQDISRGISYKVIRITPLPNNRALLELMPTRAPFDIEIMEVSENQFKHQPFEVMRSGTISYRFIPREFTTVNLISGVKTEVSAIGGSIENTVEHPALTIEEERATAERVKTQRDDMKQRNIEMEACLNKTLDEAVERVATLTSSRQRPPMVAKV